MKILSCGIVIINNNKILACVPFQRGQLDIPKGQQENGEKDIETAIRETKEETGLSFSESDLIDCGTFKYLKNKDLHLYKTFKTIDIKSCRCTSFFDYKGHSVPEVTGYIWVNAINNFYKSLQPILIKIYKELTNGIK